MQGKYQQLQNIRW